MSLLKQNAVLSLISLILACWLPLDGREQQAHSKREQFHKFVSLGHALTFQYSYPLVLCEPNTPSCRGYVPPCDLGQESAIVIACLIYGGKTYSDYNFRGATVSLGVLPDAKDTVACLSMPGKRTPGKTINGIVFEVSEDTDHAAGTYVDRYYYRTFKDRCYAADLDIAVVNFGNLDPGTVKKFTGSDEDKVYRKLRQVLDTLVISSDRDYGK